MPTAHLTRGSRLLSRWPLGLAWLAVGLAALACIWMLVQLAWALLTPLDSMQPGEQTATPADTHQPVQHVNISRLHLFGNGYADDTRRQMQAASKATTLDLTLHGTVADGDGGGYALIADDQGVERSYRVGDRIQQGVSLRAVYADHVVLSHNGVNERLQLPRDTLADAGSVKPLRRDDGIISNHARAFQQPGQGSDAGDPLYQPPQLAHGRVDWQQVQAQFKRDPIKAVAELQLVPVFDGTRMRGVRMGGGAGNPLLAGTALRADDVVTAVNGIPLDSIARGKQLFEQFRDASQLQLTVLRNGQQQTIEIDLSQAR